nr:DUF92 domain-containing protein [uncultured Mucilaginibacter sp.]
MLTPDPYVYVILLAAAIWSYTSGRLTLAGAIAGALIGFIIYKGAGLPGFVMLTFFFTVGSAATKWQRDKKALMNAADPHKARRTAWQVSANGGVAALLGAWAWLQPEYLSLAQLMMAGSFAAATADTLSSELGTVYGRRFYNIISLKKDTRGLDGVVSVEGTLIGIVGAAAIAAIYALSPGWDMRFLVIILAGFTGNVVDSVLGAWLERKGRIGNNAVNFVNTLTGATVCLMLADQL